MLKQTYGYAWRKWRHIPRAWTQISPRKISLQNREEIATLLLLGEMNRAVNLLYGCLKLKRDVAFGLGGSFWWSNFSRRTVFINRGQNHLVVILHELAHALYLGYGYSAVTWESHRLSEDIANYWVSEFLEDLDLEKVAQEAMTRTKMPRHALLSETKGD